MTASKTSVKMPIPMYISYGPAQGPLPADPLADDDDSQSVYHTPAVWSHDGDHLAAAMLCRWLTPLSVRLTAALGGPSRHMAMPLTPAETHSNGGPLALLAARVEHRPFRLELELGHRTQVVLLEPLAVVHLRARAAQHAGETVCEAGRPTACPLARLRVLERPLAAQIQGQRVARGARLQELPRCRRKFPI